MTFPTSPAPSATPLASIIVPWWDHGDLLALWQGNLAHLTGCEAIFIDNGSAAPTAQALYRFCLAHNLSLIRNEQNRGFAAANNQGVSIARAPFLLFLNNDVQILSPIAPPLCEPAKAGLAGPRLMLNDMYCPYIEGWCLCIAREHFNRLGGWAEEYTLGYWDDVDLSTRALLAGLSLTPVPQVDPLIRHLQNTTGRDGRIDQLALDAHNRTIFLRKFFNVRPMIVIDGLVFQTGPAPRAEALQSILARWVGTDFARHLLIIDRAGAIPKIQGLRYRILRPFDPSAPQQRERDRRQLQLVCDQEQASLFVATGETQPRDTRTIDLPADVASFDADSLREMLLKLASEVPAAR